MNYFETQMIGLVVENFTKDKNSLSLRFTDGSTMGIFNNYTSSKEIEAFTGAEILAVISNENNILFRFSNGGNISIGLKEDDYINGEEGFVVYKKNGPIIVDRLGDN